MKIRISPKYGILGLCLTQAVAAAPVGHYQQDFEDLAIRSHATRVGHASRSVWYGRDEPRARDDTFARVLSIIKRANDAVNFDVKRGHGSEVFSNDIDERDEFIPVYYRKRQDFDMRTVDDDSLDEFKTQSLIRRNWLKNLSPSTKEKLGWGAVGGVTAALVSAGIWNVVKSRQRNKKEQEMRQQQQQQQQQHTPRSFDDGLVEVDSRGLSHSTKTKLGWGGFGTLVAAMAGLGIWNQVQHEQQKKKEQKMRQEQEQQQQQQQHGPRSLDDDELAEVNQRGLKSKLGWGGVGALTLAMSVLGPLAFIKAKEKHQKEEKARQQQQQQQQPHSPRSHDDDKSALVWRELKDDSLDTCAVHERDSTPRRLKSKLAWGGAIGLTLATAGTGLYFMTKNLQRAKKERQQQQQQQHSPQQQQPSPRSFNDDDDLDVFASRNTSDVEELSRRMSKSRAGFIAGLGTLGVAGGILTVAKLLQYRKQKQQKEKEMQQQPQIVPPRSLNDDDDLDTFVKRNISDVEELDARRISNAQAGLIVGLGSLGFTGGVLLVNKLVRDKSKKRKKEREKQQQEQQHQHFPQRSLNDDEDDEDSLAERELAEVEELDPRMNKWKVGGLVGLGTLATVASALELMHIHKENQKIKEMRERERQGQHAAAAARSFDDEQGESSSLEDRAPPFPGKAYGIFESSFVVIGGGGYLIYRMFKGATKRARDRAKQQEGLPPRSIMEDNNSGTSHKVTKRAPPFIGTKKGIIGSVIVGLAGGGYGIYRLFKYVGEQNRKQLERDKQGQLPPRSGVDDDQGAFETRENSDVSKRAPPFIGTKYGLVGLGTLGLAAIGLGGWKLVKSLRDENEKRKKWANEAAEKARHRPPTPAPTPRSIADPESLAEREDLRGTFDGPEASSVTKVKRAPPFWGTKHGLIGFGALGLAGTGVGIWQLVKKMKKDDKKEWERKHAHPPRPRALEDDSKRGEIEPDVSTHELQRRRRPWGALATIAAAALGSGGMIYGFHRIQEKQKQKQKQQQQQNQAVARSSDSIDDEEDRLSRDLDPSSTNDSSDALNKRVVPGGKVGVIAGALGTLALLGAAGVIAGLLIKGSRHGKMTVNAQSKTAAASPKPRDLETDSIDDSSELDKRRVPGGKVGVVLGGLGTLAVLSAAGLIGTISVKGIIKQKKAEEARKKEAAAPPPKGRDLDEDDEVALRDVDAGSDDDAEEVLLTRFSKGKVWKPLAIGVGAILTLGGGGYGIHKMIKETNKDKQHQQPGQPPQARGETEEEEDALLRDLDVD